MDGSTHHSPEVNHELNHTELLAYKLKFVTHDPV
jgi:hypothetical protein